LELNETSAQGAYRETLEEAGTDVEIGSLFSIVNIAHIGQIHWFYLANMPSASFSPVTSESLEVRLFRESEIPWNELAFLTVKLTLEHFFADQKKQAITFDQVMPTYLMNINPTQRSTV
jgi:ADP-ribose pyrophosphatase YjhB (NUDIX family)